MKQKTLVMIAAVAMGLSLSASAAVDVESLRGEAVAKESVKPAKAKPVVVQGGIERNYKIQPPIIPHKIDKYRITLRNNGCMKCHSPKTYKKEKAPKVGDSHFLDRNGKRLDKVAKRRYFCNQCHIPQLNAKPLVENEFVGAK